MRSNLNSQKHGKYDEILEEEAHLIQDSAKSADFGGITLTKMLVGILVEKIGIIIY